MNTRLSHLLLPALDHLYRQTAENKQNKNLQLNFKVIGQTHRVNSVDQDQTAPRMLEEHSDHGLHSLRFNLHLLEAFV